MNIRDVSLNLTGALLRSGLEELQGKEPRPIRPPYTVTISREVGALGLLTAAEVGKRLGWPVYDQDIINKITEELGREIPRVERLDERHVGWFEEFLTNLSTSYVVSPTTYLKKLVGVVRGLGEVGKCIIVGRAANCILPAETTLRVRLVADLSDRIPRIARILALSERDAAHHIKKTDRARAQFVKNNFGKDPSDPHEYDLVLNTSRVGIEEAAQVIVDTLRLFEKRTEASRPQEAETLPVG